MAGRRADRPPPVRVSLCTTCRNRRHHLRRTLPANFADNDGYDAVELVLLDYNSSDGLAAWVRERMAAPLASGRLRYFHTAEPQSFRRSHARNVAFRLARGEILCNVDADNFTGPDFARYVASRFVAAADVFLTVDHERCGHLRDAFGRLCVRRRHFLAAGGYDEAMSGYGWEDLDLVSRLESLGLEKLVIDEERFLRYLAHGDVERVGDGEGLAGLYRGCRPEWPAAYSFVLLVDGTFRRFGLPADAALKTGTWSRRRAPGSGLRLRWSEGLEEDLRPAAGGGYAADVADGRFLLQPVEDREERARIILRLDLLENEARHRRNLERNRTPNSGGLGRATVTEGFRGRRRTLA